MDTGYGILIDYDVPAAELPPRLSYDEDGVLHCPGVQSFPASANIIDYDVSSCGEGISFPDYDDASYIRPEQPSLTGSAPAPA